MQTVQPQEVGQVIEIKKPRKQCRKANYNGATPKQVARFLLMKEAAAP